MTGSATLAPVVHAACTDAIGANLRRQLVKHIQDLGLAPDGDAWLRRAEDDTVAALAARGEALAAELGQDVPALREKLHYGGEQPWAGPQPLGYRILNLLAAQGRIVRGRPRGSWTSGQYRWSVMEAWLPGGLPGRPAAEAQAELARAWLATFGPATVADLKWWTGWTVAVTRRALAAVGAVEVELDGGLGLVLPGDVDPAPEAGPWVALLPALDPTTMGWKERAWYGEVRTTPRFRAPLERELSA